MQTGWSDPQVILAVVTAVLTFVYILVTAAIWWATLKNTEATRKILETGHRPYLGVGEIEIQSEHTTMMAVIIKIENAGTAPCHKIEADVVIPGTNSTETVEKLWRALLPGHAFGFSRELSAAEIDRWRRANRLEITIQIRYCDMANKAYRTNETYNCDHLQRLEMISGEME